MLAPEAVHHMGGMIPTNIQQELLQFIVHDAKTQRNTQAELLAIIVAMLTWTQLLRGSDLVIYDDSSATIGCALSGSSADEHSKELVATIWLRFAHLQITVWFAWVPWVPTETNPGDAPSRPKDPKKRA